MRKSVVGEMQTTQFLNVDLDVFSRAPLDPLVAAFGRKVSVHYVGRERRCYSAHLSIAGSGLRANADRLIRRFVALVDGLPSDQRRHWATAESRQFNLGIEAAAKSPPFELSLHPATLEAIVSVGGSVVITVYAPARSSPLVRSRG